MFNNILTSDLTFLGTLNDGIQETLPIVRDFDGHTYARQYNKGLMVGWFEKEAKPAFGKGTVPKDWELHVKQDNNHFRRYFF